jgi:hypothetical protein
MARPPSRDGPRTLKIEIVVNQAEKAAIEARAKDAGVPPAVFLRSLGLGIIIPMETNYHPDDIPMITPELPSGSKCKSLTGNTFTPDKKGERGEGGYGVQGLFPSFEGENHEVGVRDNHKENVVEGPQKRPAKKFVKPTREQVASYCLERRNQVDPENWYDHYESNGWMVGRVPMKDWKGAVRTWEKNAGFRQNRKPDKEQGFRGSPKLPGD